MQIEDTYEVCNCKKVLYKDIIAVIKDGATSLGEIQESTKAGTECRFCMFEEGDFGKVKKKIYCKDILNKCKGSI